MPWDIPGLYAVKIGGNYFVNCETLIAFEDVPLFTVTRRESDGRLGIDFDVYGNTGDKLAVIRRGNIVDGDTSAFDIRHGPDCHEMFFKGEDRRLCRIDKSPGPVVVRAGNQEHTLPLELAVSVTTYLPNGFLMEATAERTNLQGVTMIGNVLGACRFGIAINGTVSGAGIRLNAPAT